MRSPVFADHGMSADADYDFDAGSYLNVPMVNCRAPGRGLLMVDLTAASQIRQKLELIGDAEGAELFDKLISDTRRGLVSTAPLYVDLSRAAEMEHGARTERFFTLGEAKIAWDALPKERQEIATITSAGRTYTREEIGRFHSQRRV